MGTLDYQSDFNPSLSPTGQLFKLFALVGKNFSETASLIPQLQERYVSYLMPWMSPRIVAEYYSIMVDNFVDNTVSATNLANNLAMVNMETIQQLTDGSRAFWRTGVENVRTMSESFSQQ